MALVSKPVGEYSNCVAAPRRIRATGQPAHGVMSVRRDAAARVHLSLQVAARVILEPIGLTSVGEARQTAGSVVVAAERPIARTGFAHQSAALVVDRACDPAAWVNNGHLELTTLLLVLQPGWWRRRRR